MVAQWLDRRPDDREVLGSKPTGAASELWKFHLPKFASVFRRRDFTFTLTIVFIQIIGPSRPGFRGKNKVFSAKSSFVKKKHIRRP